jgi:hypothetical protein
MHTRTGIALATLLAICASSNAMSQSIALNDDAPTASQDVVAPAPLLTEVAWRKSTHSRLRQSRKAGLRTDGYAPGSGPQAPDPGYAPRGFPDDNYQYWRQACCM